MGARVSRWLQQTFDRRHPPRRHADDFGDPAFAAISDAVCDLAESAATVPAEIALTEIEEHVKGVVLSELEALRTSRYSAAARADAARAEADQVATTLEAQAASQESEATRAEQEIEPAQQLRDVAQGKKDVADAEYQELPLIIRAALPFAWIGVPATAGGVGALVHLALPGIHNPVAKWALVVAAVAGALLAELLIGTLCAELFQRLEGRLRAAAMIFGACLLFAAMGTTEGFATKVRSEARSKIETIEVDKFGNPTASGDLTPNLVWTFPLSLLLTLGGSGALGLNALREEGQPLRRRLKEARQRLAEAEERMRAHERRPRDHRQHADELRARAGHQTAAAAAAVTETSRLLDTIDAEAKRHEQFLLALTAKARLRYLIAAAAREERPNRLSATAAERAALTVAAVAGFGAAAGAIAAVAGASLAPSLLAGAIAMLAMSAGLSRVTRRRSPRRP